MKTPSLGGNIQAARRARGLSQEALAGQIGVSRQALGKWEKDAALPGLDNLQALAQALGCPVDRLLGTAGGDAGASPPPAAPALTAEAMQALLDAHAGAERRRGRRWGLLSAALLAAVLLAGVALGRAFRQLDAANQRLEAMGQRLDGLAGQLDDTGARMAELQDAVRQGESAVLDWQWLPAEPVAGRSETNILVTPRDWQPGLSATLLLDHGDATDVVEMAPIEASGRLSASPRLAIGEAYTLSVRLFDAAGASTVEALGELCLGEDLLAPSLEWARGAGGDEALGGALFAGFYAVPDGDGWQLSLSYLSPAVEVSVPQWLHPASARVRLLIDGAEADSAPLAMPDGLPLPAAGHVAGGTWQAMFDGGKAYPCRDLESVQWVAELAGDDGRVWRSEPLALHALDP